jgi:quercetin dioxygenase-like cupin family protein
VKTLKLPSGGNNDWIFDFDHAGEVFPEHAHAVEDNHLTIVARGSIEVMGETKFSGQTFKSGAVIVWDAPKSHGFISMGKATRIIQISQRR